jgi:hypothetical protein
MPAERILQLPRPDASPHAVAGFTVAELAARWRIGVDKIHGFIRRWELIAVNLATRMAGRPQWRVSPEEVARFEKRRSSVPTPKPTRRQRQSGIDFYADD